MEQTEKNTKKITLSWSNVNLNLYNNLPKNSKFYITGLSEMLTQLKMYDYG